MADIITNGSLQDYVINTVKQLESGELANYGDPAPPTQTGPLTPSELARIRAIFNELDNRFSTDDSPA